MGQYFLVVNTDKKQFIDAWKFGEGVETLQAVSGYHAQAVALLTCDMSHVRDKGTTLLGSWSGDQIIAAAEYASTNENGAARNLYKQAREEFEDISYKALAMLCETHEPVCWELAEKASTPVWKMKLKSFCETRRSDSPRVNSPAKSKIPCEVTITATAPNSYAKTE